MLKMILILVSLPVFSFCQTQEDIEKLEQFFRADTPNVDINGYIQIIAQSPLPDWRLKIYPDYYKTDNRFKLTIDEINNLGYSKEDYFGIPSQSIYRSIDTYTNFGEKAFLQLYFTNHFIYVPDSSVADDLFSKMNPNIDSTSIKLIMGKIERGILPMSQVGEYWEYLGDFSTLDIKYQNSVFCYLNALMIYDSIKAYAKSARIHNKIALIYYPLAHRLDEQKAMDHFHQASGDYYLANEIDKSIISNLLAAYAYLWTENEPTSLQDILTEYADHHFGKNFDFFMLHDMADINQSIEKKYRILSVAYYAKSSSQQVQQYRDMLLGNYFGQKGEYNIAKKYFEDGVACAFNYQFPGFYISDVLFNLDNLAWIYSKIGNEAEMNKFLNLEIAINEKAGNQLGVNWNYLSKGNYLYNFKKSKEGIAFVTKGLQQIDSNDRWKNLTGYKRKAYSVLTDLYANIGQMDSSNAYLIKYYKKEADNIETGNSLINLEEDYERNKFEKEIGQLRSTSEDLKKQIISLFSERRELVYTTDSLKQSIDNSRRTVDSNNIVIYKQKSAIAEQQATIRNNKRALDNMSRAFFKAVRDKRNIIFIGLTLLVIGMGFYFITVYIKNKRYLYLQSKLTNLSRAKLHNIRGNYTKLMGLIDNKNYNLTKLYVEHSAAYFSQVLNEADDKSWTLAKERDLLQRFYNAEKVFYGGVEIIPEINVNEDDVIFLSDILTTLIHNAMRHAFKEKADNRIFRITVTTDKEWLYFEVADNGIAKDSKDQYFLRKDSGLVILRDRIVNECRHKSRANPTDFFDVVINEHLQGTTFKFKFPYETTIKNTTR